MPSEFLVAVAVAVADPCIGLGMASMGRRSRRLAHARCHSRCSILDVCIGQIVGITECGQCVVDEWLCLELGSLGTDLGADKEKSIILPFLDTTLSWDIVYGDEGGTTQTSFNNK